MDDIEGSSIKGRSKKSHRSRSRLNSQHSGAASLTSERIRTRVKFAELKIKCEMLAKQQTLATKQQTLENEKEALRLEEELAKMQAREKVFVEIDSQKNSVTGNGEEINGPDTNSQGSRPANNGLAEDVSAKKDSSPDVPRTNGTAGGGRAVDGTAGGVNAVNGTTGGVPASNGTAGGVPAVNGTAGDVPASNGTASGVPAVNGTTGGVPASNGTAGAVNGTAGGVPAVNGTSGSIPGLTGDVANSSNPDSTQRQSHGRLGSSRHIDRVTYTGTPYQQSLNANATVFTPGYQQTPRVEQLMQAPAAENLLVTASIVLLEASADNPE